MFERLGDRLEDEFALLETSLADPELLGRPASAARGRPSATRTSRRWSRRCGATGPGIADAETRQELLTTPTGDERELWRAELADAETDVAALEDEIRSS